MGLGATVLNFVCQKISDMAEITEFRPKFIFRLFLKILLNIFKLLFPKFSNFGGGEITEFREISIPPCVATREYKKNLYTDDESSYTRV